MAIFSNVLPGGRESALAAGRSMPSGARGTIFLKLKGCREKGRSLDRARDLVLRELVRETLHR